jgi:enoyl-CoA hydratase/carnithine racemase
VVEGAAVSAVEDFAAPTLPREGLRWHLWHALAMSDRVSITVDNGIADVRLNRPDKLNALDQAMFQAIVDAGEGLKGQSSVRVVVLSGEGRGFCAGLDFGSFQAMAGGPPPTAAERSDGGGLGAIGDTGGRITHLGQQAAWVWQELPVPVIAAVHGPALGGGLQIALGADLRIVAPDAKLSVLEARWGLIPDMTGTVMLPRLVGLDVAKELTLTGRMVSGEEAVLIGLATRVADDPRAAALELAADLVTKSPDALREGKRLLNLSGTRPLAEQLADERKTMGSLIGSPNQVEATMAYFEKRPPKFS